MTFIIASAIVLFGFAAHAEVDVTPYFPVACAKKSLKAVKVHDISSFDEENGLQIYFELELLNCIGDSGRGFEAYRPTPPEHVLIYELDGAGTVASAKFMLSQNRTSSGRHAINFEVPASSFRSLPLVFRVDIFLMNNKIPLKLTVTPEGHALIQ